MPKVNTNPSFFESLMNQAQGAAAQINPWDNGATYQSVTGDYAQKQSAAKHRQRQAQNPQPRQQGPKLHPGTASGRGPEGYVDWAFGPAPRNTAFRMFEDGTFEGNPNALKGMPEYEGYQFFEDNSFRAPQPQNIQYEDGSGRMNGQLYGAMDSFGDIPKPGQTPYQREATSQPRLQQDPLAQLRQLLGF